MVILDNKYRDGVLQRARDEALEWLQHGDGCPRSWNQVRVDELRTGDYYDEWEAPPIAGYECLEREGLAVRIGVLFYEGEERVRFRLATK